MSGQPVPRPHRAGNLHEYDLRPFRETVDAGVTADVMAAPTAAVSPLAAAPQWRPGRFSLRWTDAGAAARPPCRRAAGRARRAAGQADALRLLSGGGKPQRSRSGTWRPERTGRSAVARGPI
jgi:hypothetical protein